MRLLSLVQHCALLLARIREGGAAPSDRVAKDFFAGRRYLGAHDRRWIGDVLYHGLRHLRRLDRALLEAGEGMEALEKGGVSESLLSAGFPVDAAGGAAVWHSRAAGAAKGGGRAEVSETPGAVDVWRAALAAGDRDRGAGGALAEAGLPGVFGDMTAERTGALYRLALERAARMAADASAGALALRHSFPDWLWDRLGREVGAGEWDALGEALNRPGEVCLRVNALRSTLESALEGLRRAGVCAQASGRVAGCLKVDGRFARGLLDQPGLAGAVEIQDEGSQVVAGLLGAQPGQTVIDACAGAGGKTLCLATAMQNRGRLWVHDPSVGRLKNLFARARRAGVSESLLGTLAPGPAAPEFAADLVVLDVPCSGLGTLRRSPELKWRLNAEEVGRRRDAQLEILERWAGWVRSGGRLAYVTCSLLECENEGVTRDFGGRHADFEWERVEAPPGFGVDAVTSEGALRLWPHRHGVDGFFLACLRRTGSAKKQGADVAGTA